MKQKGLNQRFVKHINFGYNGPKSKAINKMKRALDEFVIEGVKTTIPFHRQLMDNPDYVSGNYTTKFMEDFIMKPEA